MTEDGASLQLDIDGTEMAGGNLELALRLDSSETPVAIATVVLLANHTTFKISGKITRVSNTSLSYSTCVTMHPDAPATNTASAAWTKTIEWDFSKEWQMELYALDPGATAIIENHSVVVHPAPHFIHVHIDV